MNHNSRSRPRFTILEIKLVPRKMSSKPVISVWKIHRNLREVTSCSATGDENPIITFTFTSHKFPVVKAVIRSKSSFQRDFELFIPEKNSLLIWLLFLLMFFMTSSFTDGGGSLKASKPGKKHKMLSATCWVWSACPIPWSLKTWLV